MGRTVRKNMLSEYCLPKEQALCLHKLQNAMYICHPAYDKSASLQYEAQVGTALSLVKSMLLVTSVLQNAFAL